MSIMNRSLARLPGTLGFGQPILQADDADYIAHPPFSDAFVKRHTIEIEASRGLERKLEAWRVELVAILEEMEFWHELIQDWLARTCGVELLPAAAMNLFIEVLWLRSAGECGEFQAVQLLKDTQTLFFSTRLTKNNLVGPSNDSDDEDSITPPLPHVTSHLDPVNEAYAWKVFHSRMHGEWCNKFANDSAKQMELCNRWSSELCAFFNPNLEPPLKVIKSPENVIMVLRQMRAVSAAIYRQNTWIIAVKDSGLAAALGKICHPSTFLKCSKPHISASYRNHSWKESLGEVLEHWTPDSGMLVDAPTTSPERPSEKLTIQSLVKHLSAHDCIIPTASCPTAAYFMVTARNFNEAWQHWLYPTLESMDLNVSAWNPVEVHRLLRGISIENFEMQYPNVLHPKLRHLLVLTDKLCNDIKKTKQASFRSSSSKLKSKSTLPGKQKTNKKPNHRIATVHTLLPPSTSSSTSSSREPSAEPVIKTEQSGLNNSPVDEKIPSGGCTFCSKSPTHEQCVRYIYVTERNQDELKGIVLTAAEDPNDRLPPSKMASKDVKYFTPAELNLEKIAHRPEVHSRCGRDATVLLDIKTNEVIGAVKFKAFSNHVHGRLINHHETVSSFKPLKRGSSFQNWNYGEMRAIGSRMPQGGKPGDAYVPYAGLEATTEEELNALFEHAFVSDHFLLYNQIGLKKTKAADMLRTAAESIAPEVKRAIQETDRNTSDLNPLGSVGDNLYVCTDYTAPQHCDNDSGISLCCQMRKLAGLDEYGFAYSQWGAYIETRENTVWVFYSQHLHGTVMPRRSSRVAHQKEDGPRVASAGNHAAKTQKSAQKARQYKQIRQNYSARSNYWRT